MNRSFCDPQPDPAVGTDFVSGLWTFGGHGDPVERTGMAVHLSAADTSRGQALGRVGAVTGTSIGDGQPAGEGSHAESDALRLEGVGKETGPSPARRQPRTKPF